MGIPETQLERWSHPGGVQNATKVHNSLKTALESSNSLIKNQKYNAYLQGSYRNKTNVRGDGDVDLVVEYQGGWISDLTSLSEEEKNIYRTYTRESDYTWEKFRADVLVTLQRYYGNEGVQAGDKAIKVLARSDSLPADVVVCLPHRKYAYVRSNEDNHFVEGIVFWTQKEGEKIINYPKVHFSNGVLKNSDIKTNGLFKPTVRMFKNARTFLINNGKMTKKLAPSYFIECLIYNAPNSLFKQSWTDTYVGIVNWLYSQNLKSFMSQNEQIQLIGPNKDQWLETSAKTFIDALVTLWKNW